MGQISSGILKVEMPDGQAGYVSFGWIEDEAFRNMIGFIHKDGVTLVGFKPEDFPIPAGSSINVAFGHNPAFEIQRVWMRAIPHGWEICEQCSGAIQATVGRFP